MSDLAEIGNSLLDDNRSLDNFFNISDFSENTPENIVNYQIDTALDRTNENVVNSNTDLVQNIVENTVEAEPENVVEMIEEPAYLEDEPKLVEPVQIEVPVENVELSDETQPINKVISEMNPVQVPENEMPEELPILEQPANSPLPVVEEKVIEPVEQPVEQPINRENSFLKRNLNTINMIINIILFILLGLLLAAIFFNKNCAKYMNKVFKK